MLGIADLLWEARLVLYLFHLFKVYKLYSRLLIFHATSCSVVFFTLLCDRFECVHITLFLKKQTLSEDRLLHLFKNQYLISVTFDAVYSKRTLQSLVCQRCHKDLDSHKWILISNIEKTSSKRNRRKYKVHLKIWLINEIFELMSIFIQLRQLSLLAQILRSMNLLYFLEVRRTMNL